MVYYRFHPVPKAQSSETTPLQAETSTRTGSTTPTTQHPRTPHTSTQHCQKGQRSANRERIRSPTKRQAAGQPGHALECHAAGRPVGDAAVSVASCTPVVSGSVAARSAASRLATLMPAATTSRLTDEYAQ